MRQRTRHIGRRRLLLGGAVAGVGALTSGVRRAQAQRAQGPGGIEWLDYDPPRTYAAGARVGNVIYLSGVTGNGPGDVEAHAERAFQSIQNSLRQYGSDLDHVVKTTVYLVNMDDQAVFGQVRDRFLTRPVVSTTVAVSRLVAPTAVVEIDVMAVVPGV